MVKKFAWAEGMESALCRYHSALIKRSPNSRTAKGNEPKSVYTTGVRCFYGLTDLALNVLAAWHSRPLTFATI